jgi:hypothetical protein
VEADAATAAHRLLNIDSVDWNTHYRVSVAKA